MAIDLAVVPVAGQGTRLLPLTKSQPKEMLAVGRKTVIQYVVEELVHSGIAKICFITGSGKHSIENHFDVDSDLIRCLREQGKEELLAALEFERLQVEYFYTRQRRQLGLGDAILRSRSFVADQSFVVALGDSIIGLQADSNVVRRLVDEFEQAGADAAIAFEEVSCEDVSLYGIAEPRGAIDDVFELAGIVEKPNVGKAASNLAIAARYVFTPAIFDYLAATQPGKDGEIQLTDAIQALIREGGKVIGVRLAEGEVRYDIGHPLSYFQTFIEFALADPEFGEILSDRLREVLDTS